MAVSINKHLAAKGPWEKTLLGGRLRLFKGTIEHWLPKFDRLYFDAALTDPPYELGFMGAAWDKAGVAFNHETWRLVFRTLKPGAHLLMYGGRYAHRMTVAAEDGGFEVLDKMLWCHAQGFPKGQDIGLGIDAHNGVPRPEAELVSGNLAMSGGNYKRHKRAVVTGAAKRWEGYKTALKPAYEECVIFRRPLAGGTYAANVLLYDTGGLNVAGCRIGTDKVTVKGGGANHYAGVKSFLPYQAVNAGRDGRYPSNVVLSHHPLCRRVGTKTVKGRNDAGPGTGKRPGGFANVGHAKGDVRPNGRTYGDQTVEAWRCAPGCPVQMLDKQSGAAGGGFGARGGDPDGNGIYNQGFPRGDGRTVGYGDAGGASRFFYLAKVSRPEREAGLTGGVPKDCDNYGDDEWGKANRAVAKAVNNHPCLKPIDLNRYFATLVLPPPRPNGGKRRILVPFAGVLSEAIGALLSGWDEVYAIEQDAAFLNLGAKRAEHWLSGTATL